MNLRQLKEIINRVPERHLDLRLYIEGESEPPVAPYAFFGNDDGNAPTTLCVMGTMSCGPLVSQEEQQ